MKITTKLAIATAFVALAACGTEKAANNAEMNADMNAGMTDLNATDMNATMDMNAGGNMDMNAGGNMDMNATDNTTTNNSY